MCVLVTVNEGKDGKFNLFNGVSSCSLDCPV
jgi:hypothetical protein